MNARTTHFVLAGEVTDLFSHMALWGLARICADMGLSGIRCWWTNEPQPRAMVSLAGATEADIAQAVRRHAAIRASDQSWLHRVFTVTVDHTKQKKSTVALLAPRTAVPEKDDRASWHQLEDESVAARDGLPSDIDAELLIGLGYRSWWAVEANGAVRADKGCSAWEMRTRNQGTDFVADRLLPLAVAVAAWPEGKVWAGLTGVDVDDSTAPNKSESRTSTGFRLPGPVDSARAWCALWGLSLFPVMVDSRNGSTSPAYLPLAPGGNARHLLLVPVVTTGTSVARLAMLARSRDLVAAADAQRRPSRTPEDASTHPLAKQSARSRLHGKGVLGMMQFPVQVVGSASAPERQTLAGSFVRT